MLEHKTPLMPSIRQLGEIELLVKPRVDLSGERRDRRHHDIRVGLAVHQIRFQNVVRFENVVGNADASLPLKILQDGRVNVIGPVVDVDFIVSGRLAATRE